MNNKMYKKKESDRRSTIYYEPKFNYKSRRTIMLDRLKFTAIPFTIFPSASNPDGTITCDFEKRTIC